MQPENLSPLKKRVFTVFTILFPLLLLCLFELVLLVFNIGKDISLFKTVEMNGKEYFMLNPNIGEKYFPGNNVQIQSNDIFLVQKPVETFRIFCLGGSTVTGYPYYYNASFSSFLRERLLKIYPEKDIEIINLGMTAINSYMVLDMAKEIINYKPDLLLVYDGHNEFYGPLGVASQKSFLNSRWLNITYLQLLNSRVFLLLRDCYYSLINLFGENKNQAPAITMEMLAKGQYIPYQGEVYKKGLEIYRANVEELKTILSDRNIPLIISTQVSNLRDQLPFVSGQSNSLSRNIRDSISYHLSMGDIAGTEGRFDTAMKELQMVLQFDSANAAAHYGLAECLDIVGKMKEALIEYKKAKDYDELRFRASSDFNELILLMEDKNTGVADIEKIFMENSPDSLIGNKLILEHLHPNSYGQFLAAKAFEIVINKMELIKSGPMWITTYTELDSILWIERSVSELDELIAKRRTEYITSAWPFALKDTPVAAINENDTLMQIAESISKNMCGWGDAHLNAIEFYKNRHDWKNLEREYRVMISLLPYDVNSYLSLAALYFEQKRLNDAVRILKKSLSVKKTIFADKLIKEIELMISRPVKTKIQFAK